MLTTLPVEVLTKIIKKLELKDVRNLMLCCKKIYELILNDNYLWKWFCKEDLVVCNPKDNSKIINFSSYNKCRISQNWRKGIYRDKIVLQHRENYIPWLHYFNSEALVISVGTDLHCYSTDNKGIPSSRNFLWKLNVPKIQRHDVRTNDISRFVVKGNFIVCGNRDGSTSIYELCNIRQKPKLLYYIEDSVDNGLVEVSAVEFVNSKSNPCIVTTSCYSTNVVLWRSCTDTNEKYGKLNVALQITIPDASGVKSIASNISEDKLAIGRNGNSMPVIIDILTGAITSSVNSIKNDKLAVRDIRWHNENTIIYVTHSGRLQLFDVRIGNVVYNAMDPFLSTLYCVKSDGERAVLVGSSEYSRCVLFDTRQSSAHVQMYFTQKKTSPIYSLDFDSMKLIAAADRSVATLNFNVNVNSAQVRDYSHAFEFVTESRP